MKEFPKHSGRSYEGKARAYAGKVDSRPWNANYERPALVSLLPELNGLRVLDAGCGSGWYTEYFVTHGASVTAFDFNEDFVELTRSRAGRRANVFQADLSAPLDFAKDSEFDLIVCPLVMHYIKDWLPVFKEFHRVLASDGVLVFSTHHPFMDWQYFKTENYYALDFLEDNWDIGRICFYRRPITDMSRDLQAAGFLIERLLEPQPTEEFRQINPKEYERLTRNPQFLLIRALKRGFRPR